MAETITKKITAVSQKGDGFKVEGYDNWFNLTNDYQGVAIPPVGTEIEFTYKPWVNPKSHKTAYYVDEIIPVTQVGPTNPAPIPTAVAPPATSYAGLQQAVNAAVAQTAPPSAEPPRIEPEPLSQDTGPVLGTHASTELSIQRQVALKTAIEYLVGVYGGAAGELKTTNELNNLVANALYVARGLAAALRPETGGLNVQSETAMPDDTLVPTPSEMEEPPPPDWKG